MALQSAEKLKGLFSVTSYIQWTHLSNLDELKSVATMTHHLVTITYYLNDDCYSQQVRLAITHVIQVRL